MVDSFVSFHTITFFGSLIIYAIFVYFFYSQIFDFIKGVFKNHPEFWSKTVKILQVINFSSYEQPEVKETGGSSFYKFKKTSPAAFNAIAIQLNNTFQEKYGYTLSATEVSLILLAINRASEEECINFVKYVKNHPIISKLLFDRFVDLYHEKKSRGESINIAEIKMFLYTAKIFE